jgi:hypothetical protein
MLFLAPARTDRPDPAPSSNFFGNPLRPGGTNLAHRSVREGGTAALLGLGLVGLVLLHRRYC